MYGSHVHIFRFEKQIVELPPMLSALHTVPVNGENKSIRNRWCECLYDLDINFISGIASVHRFQVHIHML